MTHQEKLDEIRRMVRTMLKDALPEAMCAGVAQSGEAGVLERIQKAASGGGEPVVVSIAAAADLQEFARAVARACREGSVRDRIVEGKVNFRVAGASLRPGPAGKGARAGGAVELEKGVVNEVKIASLAKDHDKVIVGRGVVLTPLARDKAREAGLEIVRKAK